MVISKLDCDNIIARLELFSKNKYTKGGGVIPRVDGETVLFGPTFKWTKDPMDNTVSEAEVRETVNQYRDLINVDPEVISAYAGTRTLNWPIDDYVIKFLYGKIAVLYGIDSPGFTASPAISKKVIERFGLDKK
jgi:L-2-hydroxyglutarate oxidase LhgO